MLLNVISAVFRECSLYNLKSILNTYCLLCKLVLWRRTTYLERVTVPLYLIFLYMLSEKIILWFFSKIDHTIWSNSMESRFRWHFRNNCFPDILKKYCRHFLKFRRTTPFSKYFSTRILVVRSVCPKEFAFAPVVFDEGVEFENGKWGEFVKFLKRNFVVVTRNRYQAVNN